MDAQASALNQILDKINPAVVKMLSNRGKNIYFPKLGILSQAAQAKGKNINATIGEAREDNGSSMHLEEFETYIKLPVQNVFPYAPSYGNPDIRDQWKKFIYKKNPSLKDVVISRPIATNGLTHGLSMAGYLFMDEGDTVILSDLYWENYDLLFDNAYGAKIETFNLFKNGGFDTRAFASKLASINKGKVIVLLNFPNNPSGYTPLNHEVDIIVTELGKLANSGKKVVVIIDDAYYGLVYGENVFPESIFVKLAVLHENLLAVKLDGATKEDYVWGFRVGFMTYGIKGGTPELYEALEAKTGGAIRGNISNISHLSQSLLQNVYITDTYEATKKKKYAILKSRYDIMVECFKNPAYSKYFEPLPFNSGYFMCVAIKPGLEAEKLRQHLLEKYSTGVIVFGNVIRLAFSATPKDKIPLLIENLFKACEDLAS
ncbi:MAG TPA: aminotransferase class I/II-fold pyridoxal phosphate-dependent enzyme [Cyclobacteriaceae bacterium]|nr:aminotransferase class I/II-fold pyridoxal phosphate-dependent enzyme [Cyclobacteriaceae bacterium]